jgi:hypothetical protein
MGIYKGSIKREDRGRASWWDLALFWNLQPCSRISLMTSKFKICFSPLFAYNV